MKRTFFACFAAAVMCVLAVTASAERLTEGSVTFKSLEIIELRDSFTMDSFEVLSVENLGESHLNRISFAFDCDVEQINMDMVIYCYDAAGMPLETVDFYVHNGYVDVPELTAMIEFAPKHPDVDSNTYLYVRPMNVYSEDGRVMGICDLQLPMYKMVGWFAPVKLYSLDGRTIEVSPFLAEEYRNVGWYNAEEYVYLSVIKPKYEENKQKGDHYANIKLVNEYLPYFYGSGHEVSLYAIRTEAMDLWRNQSGTPVAYTGSAFNVTEDGTYVKIALTNVYYKKVVSFKIDFDILDAEGNVTGKDYENYYATDADLAPCETGVYSWRNDEAAGPVTVAGYTVEEITFEDGSVWSAS